ncbi:hypothetical protein FPV67DRAFT_1453825 [Lyophyllum atratum]|nr:hypothetical protein FPV67DRAFT_1454691 [Lyophyllum atratum]KAF8059597.1 hypothetical protein FPV67DRAFT_1453825 [Lyophyllum atratum]
MQLHMHTLLPALIWLVIYPALTRSYDLRIHNLTSEFEAKALVQEIDNMIETVETPVGIYKGFQRQLERIPLAVDADSLHEDQVFNGDGISLTDGSSDITLSIPKLLLQRDADYKTQGGGTLVFVECKRVYNKPPAAHAFFFREHVSTPRFEAEFTAGNENGHTDLVLLLLVSNLILEVFDFVRQLDNVHILYNAIVRILYCSGHGLDKAVLTFESAMRFLDDAQSSVSWSIATEDNGGHRIDEC